MKKYKWFMITALIFLLTGCQKSEEVPTLVESGMSLIEQGKYSEAMKQFEVSISSNEDELLSYRGIGIAHMGNGEYEKAVQAFDQALELTDDKMQDLRKDMLYYKASALYKDGKIEDTIGTCDEILTTDQEADAYYLRGICYLELEDEEKAKVNFDAAVNKTPNDYELYLNIYQSYKIKKLSAKGDIYLQKALDIETQSDEEAYNKARLFMVLEDYDSAKNQLVSLVETQDANALLLMGQIYLAMDDPEHSQDMYHQYMEEHGETTKAFNGIVLANILKEDYTEALEYAKAGLALEEETGKQELYFNEIVIYEYLHDFKTAKEKAAEYIEAYPEDAAGYKEYEFLKSR